MMAMGVSDEEPNRTVDAGAVPEIARDFRVNQWCSVVLSRANCNGRPAASC